MNGASAQRDLVDDSRTLPLLWGLPTALMLSSVCWTSGDGFKAITWTLSLLVMGTACLVNARGCGRIHCYFTGPFFLLIAVVSLLHGLRWLSLGPHGWLYIGVVLMSGATFLFVVPEWVLGRYRHGQDAAHGG